MFSFPDIQMPTKLHPSTPLELVTVFGERLEKKNRRCKMF